MLRIQCERKRVPIKPRIGLISEWIDGASDEGIRNFISSVAKYCGEHNDVAVFTRGSGLPANRAFLGLRFRSALQRFRPDLVLYISPSSAKFWALVRAKVLKAYLPVSKVYVVALQPVHYSGPARRIVPLLSPDGILVQSARSLETFTRFHIPATFLPSGVDTDRFSPVSASRKLELRRQYDVDERAFVVLHVGHIKRSRNVESMSNIASMDGVRPLLVGSRSTRQNDELAEELTRKGVLVIRDYLPRVEEIYQLADAYYFPVISEDDSIGVPLSVLEAMACNLPVITTRFGGLPLMFERGGGLEYFDGVEQVPELIAKAKRLGPCATRVAVEPYDWKNVVQMMLELALPEGDQKCASSPYPRSS